MTDNTDNISVESYSNPSDKFVHIGNEKLVIILNHWKFSSAKSRPGTCQDVINIIKYLQLLKCNYFVFNNLKKSEILNNVPNYVKSKLVQLNEIDGLIFFILSHGSAADQLKAYDDSYYLFDFVTKFNSVTLPTMANKPKLFFISACRGKDYQKTQTVSKYTGSTRSIVADSISIVKQPRQMGTNVLIAFSTYPNTRSRRQIKKGTIFIQGLCNTLDAFIKGGEIVEQDIMDILLKTNKEVIQYRGNSKDPKTNKAKMQLVEIYNSLTAPCVFRKKLNYEM